MKLELLCKARDDRDQIEEAVGDVERDDTVRLHVPKVRLQRLACDQMHGDRVARKRVDREHIEILRRLALQRQARIAERNLDAGTAVPQKSEFAARNADDVGIDVVEAIDVPWPPIGRNGARAEPDHADAY